MTMSFACNRQYYQELPSDEFRPKGSLRKTAGRNKRQGLEMARVYFERRAADRNWRRFPGVLGCTFACLGLVNKVLLRACYAGKVNPKENTREMKTIH